MDCRGTYIHIYIGKVGRRKGNILVKVLRAAIGNSISMSWRSWLKRLRVTPESVLTKKDMGALYRR